MGVMFTGVCERRIAVGVTRALKLVLTGNGRGVYPEGNTQVGCVERRVGGAFHGNICCEKDTISTGLVPCEPRKCSRRGQVNTLFWLRFFYGDIPW